MKYEAMMNGATNISKRKNATLIYFINEDELDFFDMRKVKKNGDYAKSIISKNCGLITTTNSIIANSKNKSICKLNNVQKSLTFSGYKLQV